MRADTDVVRITTMSRFFSSRRRGTCIWLGFAVLLMLALVPPWIRVITEPHGLPDQRTRLWHAPLFHEPDGAKRWESTYVDYPRMLAPEIAVGECFVLALYLTRAPNKGQQSARLMLRSGGAGIG